MCPSASIHLPPNLLLYLSRPHSTRTGTAWPGQVRQARAHAHARTGLGALRRFTKHPSKDLSKDLSEDLPKDPSKDNAVPSDTLQDNAVGKEDDKASARPESHRHPALFTHSRRDMVRALRDAARLLDREDRKPAERTGTEDVEREVEQIAGLFHLDTKDMHIRKDRRHKHDPQDVVSAQDVFEALPPPLLTDLRFIVATEVARQMSADIFHREGEGEGLDQDAFMARVFHPADTDNDGRLTQQEFNSFLVQMGSTRHSTDPLLSATGRDGGTGPDALDPPIVCHAEGDSTSKKPKVPRTAAAAEKTSSAGQAEVKKPVPAPTATQLRAVFIRAGVPFVGFGFLDNFIMILAGDWIDLHMGVAFGITGMAAAGLGNLISDVAGVGCGGYIDSMACKLGLPDPNLSRTQATLSSVKRAVVLGNVVGISVGCVLGMVPLLWLSH